MEIDKQLDLMVKWEIDANQYFLIELLNLCQQEGGAKYLYKYFDRLGSSKLAIPGSSILDLVDKKILKPFNQNEPLFYDTLEFTESFVKQQWVDKDIAGYELWEAFPIERSYRIDKDRPLFTKKLGGNFLSKEDFYRFYCKTIRYSKAKHTKVLAALEVAKANQQIDFTIEDWVKGEMWENFKAKKIDYETI